MGVPGYGFDWTVGKRRPLHLLFPGGEPGLPMGAKIQWDNVARVPYFKYTQNGQYHEVWFESKSSLEHKLDIVKEYNIGGIALWRLGPLRTPGFGM